MTVEIKQVDLDLLAAYAAIPISFTSNLSCALMSSRRLGSGAGGRKSRPTLCQVLRPGQRRRF